MQKDNDLNSKSQIQNSKRNPKIKNQNAKCKMTNQNSKRILSWLIGGVGIDI